MNITIKKDRLIHSVNESLRAVASKTPLPILTTLKLFVSDQGLTVTGSDSDITIESFVPVEEEENQIIEINSLGEICLNARIFSEIIRKLPSDTIKIEVKDNFQTIIKSGKSEFKINGLDAINYPRLPSLENSKSYQLPTDLLKTIIRQTVYAVSTSETRPILTGVNWRVENEQLICGATDSHRLSKKTISFESSENINIIIPGKSLDEFSKLLSDDNEVVEISFTPNQILFKAKNILFYSRLLEGNYPDIERLIPIDRSTSLKLNTKDLLHAIDRASILARENRSNTVKLMTTVGSIEISSNTPEVGDVVEDVQLVQMNGDEVTISFNAKYMMDALKTVEGDEVEIHFTGTMRPFVLNGENDETLIQLILPVRTV